MSGHRYRNNIIGCVQWPWKDLTFHGASIPSGNGNAPWCCPDRPREKINKRPLTEPKQQSESLVEQRGGEEPPLNTGNRKALLCVIPLPMDVSCSKIIHEELGAVALAGMTPHVGCAPFGVSQQRSVSSDSWLTRCSCQSSFPVKKLARGEDSRPALSLFQTAFPIRKLGELTIGKKKKKNQRIFFSLVVCSQSQTVMKGL